MFSMDLKLTGIGWLAKKFGDLYYEIDNIMAQEIAKNADIQAPLQTVGENVRKFCTDVMQDLLPPSSEASVKGSAGDLSIKHNVDVGMCKKSNIGIEECPVNKEPTPPVELKAVVSLGEDLSPASVPDRPQYKNYEEAPDSLPTRSIPNSVTVTGHHCSQKFGENNNNNVSDTVACITDAPVASQPAKSVLPVTSHNNKVLESRRHCSKKSGENNNDVSDAVACITDISCALSLPESVLPVVLHNNKVLGSVCHCSQNSGENNSNVSDPVACVTDLSSAMPSTEYVLPVVLHNNKVLESGLIQSGSVLSTEGIGTCTSHGRMSPVGPSRSVHEEDSEPFVSETFLPPPEIAVTEKSNGVDAKKAYKGDDMIFPSASTIEVGDMDLGESYVDAEENEVHFIAFQANKNRSFKKKLRDVFASNKQSARKKETEPVQIWLDHFDKEAEHRWAMSKSSTTLGNLDTQNLTSQDICDSDWELV